MRRENRKQSKTNLNTIAYIMGGILLLAIAVFVITFIIYSNQVDNDLYALDSDYLEKYNYITETGDTTSASSSIGKTIKEAENSIINNASIANSINESKSENKTKTVSNTTKTTVKESITKIEKDPVFVKPIEGKILKEYAKDSLVYSETLKEWTTHLGIDIKAERATVVKSAADGIVKYIKNDPRFGLTIIIEHSNGFETRYCNLLTTEFVSEGEKVKAGQTIGTIGDSAVYEIVDEPHLHFEILKNNENVNPTKYIKFE